MNEFALAAFQEAKKSGEAGWHTISSILIPYIAISGKYTAHSAMVTIECLELAAKKILKVRFARHGRLEFKLA